MNGCSPTAKERNTKKDECYLPLLVTFRVVLVEFGVVLVTPRTGPCVTVAYESRARWRSPINTITMTCWSRARVAPFSHPS